MKAQTLWKVRGVIMNFLDTYTERLRVAGKTALAQSIEMTVARFCGEFLDGFDYCSATSALLVGNVQSGKTGQMLGIISAAADRDFFVFVILTTDNVLLQQQTLSRVKNDLPDFCVCGEDDSVLFEVNDGVKPAVIVLKKNARTLRRWEKTFLTSRILVGNPLFILDDEADAASLNAIRRIFLQSTNVSETSAGTLPLASILKSPARRNPFSCRQLFQVGGRGTCWRLNQVPATSVGIFSFLCEALSRDA